MLCLNFTHEQWCIKGIQAANYLEFRQAKVFYLGEVFYHWHLQGYKKEEEEKLSFNFIIIFKFSVIMYPLHLQPGLRALTTLPLGNSWLSDLAAWEISHHKLFVHLWNQHYSENSFVYVLYKIWFVYLFLKIIAFILEIGI